MGTIKIKGRRDVLHVADDKARAISIAKSTKSDDVRIKINHGGGMVWEGEIKDLGSIEYTEKKDSVSQQDATQATESKLVAQWVKLDHETRVGKCMAPFRLWYGVRYSIRINDEIPFKILTRARALISDYLKDYKEWNYLKVPHTIYIKALPEDTVQVLRPKPFMKKTTGEVDIYPKPDVEDVVL